MNLAPVVPFRYPTPLQRTIAQRWVDAAKDRIAQATRGGNPEAIAAAQAAYDELVGALTDSGESVQ